MKISRTQLRNIVKEAIKENLGGGSTGPGVGEEEYELPRGKHKKAPCHALKQEGYPLGEDTDEQGRTYGKCSQPGCVSSDVSIDHNEDQWCDYHMDPKNREKGKKLNEGASSIQKDVMPGSGDLSKIAEDVDKLLMDTSKKAKELVEKIEEELKTDVLGGEGKPAMASKVGERNRALLDRAGVLKRLSTSAISMVELLRQRG